MGSKRLIIILKSIFLGLDLDLNIFQRIRLDFEILNRGFMVMKIFSKGRMERVKKNCFIGEKAMKRKFLLKVNCFLLLKFSSEKKRIRSVSRDVNCVQFYRVLKNINACFYGKSQNKAKVVRNEFIVS